MTGWLRRFDVLALRLIAGVWCVGFAALAAAPAAAQIAIGARTPDRTSSGVRDIQMAMQVRPHYGDGPYRDGAVARRDIDSSTPGFQPVAAPDRPGSGATVTLWDEIAPPPAQLPQPVDSAQTSLHPGKVSARLY
jgi:hypothetical protein